MIRVIFRMWIAGELVMREEHLLDARSDIVGLAERHKERLTEDVLWLVEIEFPDDPIEERFLRFGTDEAGMVDPLPMIL